MASLSQVGDTIADAIIALLNAAGGSYQMVNGARTWIANPPNQVMVGWPFGTSLTEILGDKQALVSVFPLTEASRTVTDRKPEWRDIEVFEPTFYCSTIFNGTSVTFDFYGIPNGGMNVVPILGKPVNAKAAWYQTTDDDTLETIAAAVGSAIRALALTGVTVLSAGSTVTVSWTAPQSFGDAQCNIGGTSTMAQELARVMTPYQISIWCPNAPVRNSMSDQIENNLCVGLQNNFLYAVDGSAIRVRKRGGPRWNDKSQRSYSLYVVHIVYEVTYPTLQTTTGTAVEFIDVNSSLLPTFEPSQVRGNPKHTAP